MSEVIKTDENGDSTSNEDDSLNSNKKSDFVSMIGRVFSSINFKMCLFLFFAGMLIFSDLFIDGFLSRCDGCVDGICTTSKGTMIQLIIYILCFVVLDLLIKGEWI